jgi:hypothetical protein
MASYIPEKIFTPLKVIGQNAVQSRKFDSLRSSYAEPAKRCK